MVFKSLIGASCIIASLVSVSSVNAASIDFGIEAPTPGTISYAGGSASLVGSGIEVDTIVGLGTTLNPDTIFTCDFCVLDFATGANTGGWDFGSGGTITITGGVSAAGIATGSTLLSGTFDNASVYQITSGVFNFNIAGAGFTDTKHADLLSHFGITSNDFVGGLNLSFAMNGTPNLGDLFTSSELYSGDIVNTVVPVPAAVWLFGTGLLGLVGVARRKAA